MPDMNFNATTTYIDKLMETIIGAAMSRAFNVNWMALFAPLHPSLAQIWHNSFLMYEGVKLSKHWSFGAVIGFQWHDLEITVALYSGKDQKKYQNNLLCKRWYTIPKGIAVRVGNIHTKFQL